MAERPRGRPCIQPQLQQSCSLPAPSTRHGRCFWQLPVRSALLGSHPHEYFSSENEHLSRSIYGGGLDVSSLGVPGSLLIWGSAGSPGRAKPSPSPSPCSIGAVAAERDRGEPTASVFPPGRPDPGAKATSLPCEIDKWWFSLFSFFSFFFFFPSWFLAESKMSLLFGFLLPLPHRLFFKGCAPDFIKARCVTAREHGAAVGPVPPRPWHCWSQGA